MTAAALRSPSGGAASGLGKSLKSITRSSSPPCWQPGCTLSFAFGHGKKLTRPTAKIRALLASCRSAKRTSCLK
ncbi:hypothetical protein AD940_14360 [Gluconobacter thailandicus]|nr:hypothetical protein AD940_14360 [Gluconobacter thailandicus]